MTNKIGFLFAGQGSQQVGMGRDFYDEFDEVKNIFHIADKLTDGKTSKLCFEGNMEELTKTVNLQPAITTFNLSVLKVLQKNGIIPEIAAGHSLGEFSALAAAETLTPETCLKSVIERGELMHREATKHKGVMSAVLKVPFKSVSEVVDNVKKENIGAINLANLNTPFQSIISGSPEAVKKVSEIIKEKGGRTIALKVSGAWHSEHMQGAVDDFDNFLNNISFSHPKTKVVFNSTANFENDPDKIKDIMVYQLTNPVNWHESINKMKDAGINIFVEIGPKPVLQSMLGQILPEDYDYEVYSISCLEDVEDLVDDLEE